MPRSLAFATATSILVHGACAVGLLVPRIDGSASLVVEPHAEGLVGDSFDLERAPLVAAATPAREDAPGDRARGDDLPPTEAPVRRAPTAAASRGSRGAASSASSSDAALYGAVGERGASDFATAFTRAFAQAASADPEWIAASYGSAGRARVEVTLSPTGAIEHWSLSGTPSRALASGIRRTFALVSSRLFTAQRRTIRLDLDARVTRDEVHDGLHGDVFALGATHTGARGSAFFALAIGRRIDLDVTAR